MKRLSELRKELDKTSPSFCLAKWKQLTLHLQNGHSHSCHHPPSRQVPQAEVARRPDALHNSSYKLERRKEMLEGKRPEECSYCWNIEDLPGNPTSDRLLKSADDWALSSLEEVRSSPWDRPVNPSYLEVSFSNTCNFKCLYCSPHLSSKWMEELRRFGSYPHFPIDIFAYLEREKKMPIPEGDPNPYVEAFWKWWPELYPALKVLRITGGEPLLTRNTFRVLEYVKKNPRQDLELAINSNLGVPEKVLSQFIDASAAILAARSVRCLQIYTSIDTWGEQAEYIRSGLDLEMFQANSRRVLKELPDAKFGIICTFSALSVPSLHLLLEHVVRLKKEFGPRVSIDFPYLTDPGYLSAKILPVSFATLVENCLRLVERHAGERGFTSVERDKLARLLQWFSAPVTEESLSPYRKEFFRFVSETDRRRGTDFQRVFPELREFYATCQLECLAAP